MNKMEKSGKESRKLSALKKIYVQLRQKLVSVLKIVLPNDIRSTKELLELSNTQLCQEVAKAHNSKSMEINKRQGKEMESENAFYTVSVESMALVSFANTSSGLISVVSSTRSNCLKSSIST